MLTDPTRHELDFRSDNVGCVAPEIMDAILRVNVGTADGYGRDDASASLQEAFSREFEAPTDVFVTATGTAANAVSLAALTMPWGAVVCHPSAHIANAECGAPEFFTGGAKLLFADGPSGRIDPDNLLHMLECAGSGFPHRVQPMALSITQPTDLGTVYSLPHLDELCEVARKFDLRIHMDGARFGNALATLKCSAAEMSWRRGVDLLSYGATKNGGMFADAIVSFDRGLSDQIRFRLRRAGQTFSKMRYASAQLTRHVENGLYLRTAVRANELAQGLVRALAARVGMSPIYPVEANEVFLKVSDATAAGLAARNVLFHRFPENIIRLVLRWDSTEDEIARLVAVLREITSGSELS